MAPETGVGDRAETLARVRLAARTAEHVDVVRVIHVCPTTNTGYQQSLDFDPYSDVGESVADVWAALLRYPDRFLSVDSGVFLDPSITSPEYIARDGEERTAVGN